MGNLIKSWDASGGRGCVLYVDSLAIGRTTGPWDDNWGSCSHEEFLAGQYQDIVLDYFGKEVLDEIISLIKDKGENPIVIEKRTEDYNVARLWESIPLNRELESIFKKYEERGYDHYCKKDGYMIFFPEIGFEISGDEESPVYQMAVFKKTEKAEFIPFSCNAAIYCNGLLHLAGGEMAIFDKEGNCLLDSFSSEKKIKWNESIPTPFPYLKSLMLGDQYRITDIYRRGHHVVYLYKDYFSASDVLRKVVGETGLLKISPEGIICRWVLER